MSDDEQGAVSEGTDRVSDRNIGFTAALTYAGENRLKQWLLLTGSRLRVAAVLLGLVFVSLFVLATIRPIEVRALLTETDAAKTLFSSLLSGAILLVSIVVSINSIVLSQEITDIESQQERIAASVQYRQHIEEFIEADVTPARPAEFLTTVLYAISRQTARLQQIARERSIEAFERQVEDVADEVGDEIEQARNILKDAQVGSFNVLLAGLNYDNSGQLHAVRSVKLDFESDLDEDAREALEDLIETLQHIATAREYFKSLYYKRELARLSSLLLYVSLPVIVFMSYVILALDANLFPELSGLGVSPLLVSFIFAYTVSPTPFVVLTAYVVRASTVTMRTLAAGPFILQSGSEVATFDWERPDDAREWEFSENPDEH